MQTRRTAALGGLIMLATLACMPAFAQTPQAIDPEHESAPISEADDALHYKYWGKTPYNGAYTEWWYFNFYDKKNDLQAIFSYQVVDPQNITGKGVSFVSAAAFKGSNIVNTFDLHQLSSFSASYSAANVTMGPDTITVLDQDTYQVNGSSSDGRIIWNLLYDRKSDPWFAADRVNVGQAAWEEMSWLLYMPRAHVSGTVMVDGTVYMVDSTGYHDHNWGEWNLAEVKWNWAQYSNRDLAFDLGDFIGNPNGRAAIDVAGRRTVFTASQYKLVHTKWAHDAENKTDYPVESVFTADNGDVHLSVTMDVQKTDPLPAIPGLIIYEQATHFKGTVTISGEGSSSKISFDGNGFKEYTATAGSTPQPQ